MGSTRATLRIILGGMLTVALSACAVKGGPPPKIRGAGVLPTGATTFTIVADSTGGGCHKESAPDAVIAQAGGTMTWTIRNSCGKPVVVTLRSFDEKHRQLGKFDPFSSTPPPVTIAASAEGTIQATIKPSIDDDERGFHVFRYVIRIEGGGVVHKHDPEIIIEWP